MAGSVGVGAGGGVAVFVAVDVAGQPHAGVAVGVWVVVAVPLTSGVLLAVSVGDGVVWISVVGLASATLIPGKRGASGGLGSAPGPGSVIVGVGSVGGAVSVPPLRSSDPPPSVSSTPLAIIVPPMMSSAHLSSGRPWVSPRGCECGSNSAERRSVTAVYYSALTSYRAVDGPHGGYPDPSGRRITLSLGGAARTIRSSLCTRTGARRVSQGTSGRTRRRQRPMQECWPGEPACCPCGRGRITLVRNNVPKHISKPNTYRLVRAYPYEGSGHRPDSLLGGAPGVLTCLGAAGVSPAAP